MNLRIAILLLICFLTCPIVQAYAESNEEKINYIASVIGKTPSEIKSSIANKSRATGTPEQFLIDGAYQAYLNR